MAKVRNNLVIHGLSGMLGKQLVIRRQKDGSFVVGAAPKRSDSATLSDAQKAQRQRFRDAVVYARGARGAPEYQEAAKARKTSAHLVAVADFLHPPEIEAIDASGYTGAAGQRITITAIDDVRVKTVGVLISTEDGTFIEKGAAVISPENPSQWTYMATAAASSETVKIVVDVADLAGHVTEKTAQVSAAS